jgi:cell division protein FtsZ
MNPFIGKKLARPESKGLQLKVLGIGGAGCRIAEHLSEEQLGGQVEVYGVSADAQALGECRVERKFALGSQLTGGLGTGGEPDRGRAAAMEDTGDIETLFTGTDLVFILAGLGGGTGTGAAPFIAATAKKAGALVIAFVTMPFKCEGGRRDEQANAGLRELHKCADGVVRLPNQQVFKLINEDTSLIETFKTTNEYVAQGVGAIWRMVNESGLINVDFSDLCSMIRGREANSSFATVEAAGPNRVREVMDRLMAHPLLEDGRALGQAESVLVSVAGASSLSMTEVDRLMELLGRSCESAKIKMGATLDDRLGDRLTVTVVAASRFEPAPAKPSDAPVGIAAELEEGEMDSTESEDPDSEPLSTAAPVRAWRRRRRKNNRMNHPELSLVNKPENPFTASEPTMHNGQDLDIPTFVRRGLVLN